jgi:DNA replication protein DnaC
VANIGDVPKRFTDASYKDWEEGSVIRTIVDRYLKNFEWYFERGQGPLFLGNSGLGKSRAAAAILNAVDRGSNGRYTVSWCPVTQTLNTMLDARDMHNRDVYNNLYREIARSDLIVFDDFTTLRGSPRLKEYFWMFVEMRYSACLPTIFTANFTISQEEDIEEFWHNIATHFSTAFVRRLKELGSELTLIV